MIEITISNFSLGWGSYFFALLSMMIRSNFTMIPIIDTINANAVSTTMTVSYVVIAHHLRFSDFPKTSRNVNFEGLCTFVMTTKDNHLPYTAVPFVIITYHIFSNFIFRQNSAYTVFDDLLSPAVFRRTFNMQLL